MNTHEWFNSLVNKYKDNAVFTEEAAIFEFTENIVLHMEQLRMNRAQLAKRLNTSKAYITKILNGNANFTIKSMAAIAHALGCELTIGLRPKESASLSLNPHSQSLAAGAVVYLPSFKRNASQGKIGHITADGINDISDKDSVHAA